MRRSIAERQVLLALARIIHRETSTSRNRIETEMNIQCQSATMDDVPISHVRIDKLSKVLF